MYEPGKGHRDPYKWFAPCRFVDRETVEIVGAQEAPTPSEWKAVLKAFGAMGVKVVFYKRYIAGRERVFRHRTKAGDQ